MPCKCLKPIVQIIACEDAGVGCGSCGFCRICDQTDHRDSILAAVQVLFDTLVAAYPLGGTFQIIIIIKE